MRIIGSNPRSKRFGIGSVSAVKQIGRFSRLIALSLLPLSAFGVPISGDEFNVELLPGTIGTNPIGGTGMFTIGAQDSNGNFMIDDFEFILTEATYSSDLGATLLTAEFVYNPIGNFLLGSVAIPSQGTFAWGIDFSSTEYNHSLRGVGSFIYSRGGYTITPKDGGVIPVPEPGTLSLLIAGLFGFSLARRRERMP